MIQPKSVKQHAIKVINYEGVSLRAVCSQLYTLTGKYAPIPEMVPVSLTVAYGLNSIGARSRRLNPVSWHLRLPDAAAVLSAVNEVLVQAKLYKDTQVVACTVVKYPTEDQANVLDVQVDELAPACRFDAPTIELKTLQYYIQQCELKSKKPTFTQYKHLLASLKKKTTSKKQNESAILASLLKNSKDVDFSKE